MSRDSGSWEDHARDVVRACLERPRTAAADVYLKEGRYWRIHRSPEGTALTEASETGFAVRLFRADPHR